MHILKSSSCVHFGHVELKRWIIKSLWVTLEMEGQGSFTLRLLGFFPFTHSLVNDLCFKP